ncbi:MAG: hypothetical protein RMI94_01520 [Bryobacterales bacterium]|nr:hypothetical protein [Bryobacteraceae bacterium]MDW8129200.1 hypothetical protein [Bryobacterales bacterium]
MALRVETLALASLSCWLAAGELRYEVRHDHFPGSGRGTLSISVDGVRYREHGKPAHSRDWSWDDVQQLLVAERTLRLLTYEDSRWRLGRDRSHRYELAGAGSFEAVWTLLKDRLDQRLVAALARPEGELWWSMPAKRLRRLGGDHGELLVTEAGVVFRSRSAEASRTWRWKDLDSVSRTGPFQLIFATYERALADYGGLKSFAFQLKRPLGEEDFRRLWLRVNRRHGLQTYLTTMERSTEP